MQRNIHMNTMPHKNLLTHSKTTAAHGDTESKWLGQTPQIKIHMPFHYLQYFISNETNLGKRNASEKIKLKIPNAFSKWRMKLQRGDYVMLVCCLFFVPY